MCLPVSAQNRGATNMAVGQVSITTAATRVVASRPDRIRAVLTNGTTSNVWCGPDSTVTIATGDVLEGTSSQSTGHIKTYDYQGDIWCVSTSSNNVITFLELY